MTPRDQIAAIVAGAMSSVALEADWIARRSYDIADALIKFRGESAPEKTAPSPAPSAVNDKPVVVPPLPAVAPPKRNPTDRLRAALSSDWVDMGEIREATGLTYPQVVYQLKKLSREVENKKEGKKNLYRLTANRATDKLEFAKSLGYSTIPAALEAMGSWEFERRFKEASA